MVKIENHFILSEINWTWKEKNIVGFHSYVDYEKFDIKDNMTVVTRVFGKYQGRKEWKF